MYQGILTASKVCHNLYKNVFTLHVIPYTYTGYNYFCVQIGYATWTLYSVILFIFIVSASRFIAEISQNYATAIRFSLWSPFLVCRGRCNRFLLYLWLPFVLFAPFDGNVPTKFTAESRVSCRLLVKEGTFPNYSRGDVFAEVLYTIYAYDDYVTTDFLV